MHPYRTQAERPDYSERLRPPPREPLHPGWYVAGAYMMIGVLAAACLGPHGPTKEQMAAEATYGSMLLSCVEEAKTLAESKACRARVDAAWGVTSTSRDGGR